MATAKNRVGFVGVGRMGANMARRLADERYPVVAVMDIDRARAVALARELGCEAADTPARVAALATTVITVVTDDQAMREIFSPGNPGSLLPHAKGRLFINCATVSPTVHVEIQDLVERAGGHTLEACMASSIPRPDRAP